MVKCYICDSVNIKKHNEINGFQLLKCKTCNLIWVSNKIENDVIQNFYNEDYFNSNEKTGYNDYNNNEKLHRENANSIINLIKKTIDLKNKKVLDIGCASGFFLDEFRKQNCDVYGVEISSFGYKYAKENLNLNVINSEFTPQLFEEKYFDIVLLLGTIEHLNDPKNVLIQILKILKDDGLLVITTIDTKGLIPIYMLKPPEHLFYFNHNNFLKLLKSINYKKLIIKPYFVKYFIYDLFFRISKIFNLSIYQFINLSIYQFMKKRFNKLSVKIPTNEMIIIAKKIDIE